MSVKQLHLTYTTTLQLLPHIAMPWLCSFVSLYVCYKPEFYQY